MKIYIAGPMSGLPELNFQNFHRVAKTLRDQGHEVVNPAEINPDLNADWLGCMVEDIQALGKCDAICLLNGWEKSWGAKIEFCVAKKLDLYRMLESDLYYHDDE